MSSDCVESCKSSPIDEQSSCLQFYCNKNVVQSIVSPPQMMVQRKEQEVKSCESKCQQYSGLDSAKFNNCIDACDWPTPQWKNVYSS